MVVSFARFPGVRRIAADSGVITARVALAFTIAGGKFVGIDMPADPTEFANST